MFGMSDSCLTCEHGSFELSKKLLGNTTKGAMGCRVCEPWKCRPIRWGCEVGRYQKADDAVIEKRVKWVGKG